MQLHFSYYICSKRIKKNRPTLLNAITLNLLVYCYEVTMIHVHNVMYIPILLNIY